VLNGYRQQNQDQLYRFRFRAKQAEVDTTSIIFSGAEGFLWQDDRKAYPALVDSVVRVRVCRDNGAQLIGRVAQPRLISVTPNPARETVSVEYQSAGSATLSITDALGACLSTIDVSKTETSAMLMIRVDDLPAGPYYVTLVTNAFINSQLLIVVP
jgi:hypothetical protein